MHILLQYEADQCALGSTGSVLCTPLHIPVDAHSTTVHCAFCMLNRNDQSCVICEPPFHIGNIAFRIWSYQNGPSSFTSQSPKQLTTQLDYHTQKYQNSAASAAFRIWYYKFDSPPLKYRVEINSYNTAKTIIYWRTRIQLHLPEREHVRHVVKTVSARALTNQKAAASTRARTC